MPNANTSSAEWLLMLNFPNGGSTALAMLLLTPPGTVALEPRAEGQRIAPALLDIANRWNPDATIDYGEVRKRWLAALPATGLPLVVEKSPPNMCRYRAILAMLADMKTTLVVMTRDPYATCASWQTYGPKRIGRNWGWAGAAPTDDWSLHQALAELWIKRARYLDAARADCAEWIRYEDFADRPREAIHRLARHVPRLAAIDPEAILAVKSYAPQTVRNMNARQLERLSGEQRKAIASVLERHADLVARMGYGVAPPARR